MTEDTRDHVLGRREAKHVVWSIAAAGVLLLLLSCSRCPGPGNGRLRGGWRSEQVIPGGQGKPPWVPGCSAFFDLFGIRAQRQVGPVKGAKSDDVSGLEGQFYLCHEQLPYLQRLVG